MLINVRKTCTNIVPLFAENSLWIFGGGIGSCQAGVGEYLLCCVLFLWWWYDALFWCSSKSCYFVSRLPIDGVWLCGFIHAVRCYVREIDKQIFKVIRAICKQINKIYLIIVYACALIKVNCFSVVFKVNNDVDNVFSYEKRDLLTVNTSSCISNERKFYIASDENENLLKMEFICILRDDYCDLWWPKEKCFILHSKC